jgi:hypothetical protein
MAQQLPANKDVNPRNTTAPEQTPPIQYVPVPETQIILQMLADMRQMLVDIHQVILKRP